MKCSSEQTAVNRRAGELLLLQQQANYKRTDRLFACLMVLQFVCGVLAAFTISPRTWTGTVSQVHAHVWAATILGGAIIVLPVSMAMLMPGRTATRHVIACAQLLFSGLLIHVTGGRIETHFHVFGSLAFLVFYRDWRVLISASVVTALDHVLRGMFWPESIFGVMSATWWRPLEHAGWVVFMDIFLIHATVMATREMSEIANRRAELEAARDSIERTVQKRTAELELSNQSLVNTLDDLRLAEESRDKAQIDLLDASRRAGMAEVATGVLHNVGNILNSVNVSSDSVARRAKSLPIRHLEQATDMIQSNVNDLGTFFSEDTKGTRLPAFLERLAKSMHEDQEIIVAELDKLKSRIEHIRHIIDAQQKHGSSVVVSQKLNLQELVEQVVEINACSLDNHGIKTEVRFFGQKTIETDRHLLMQILVNLLSNAKRAMRNNGQRDKIITITVQDQAVAGAPGVGITVTDTGVGIPSENMARIFQHGFTTRKEGRGFGLHSAANAARSMGGGLVAFSDGSGCGAAFTLTLPSIQSSKKVAAA